MNSNFKNNTIIILRPKDRAKCLERLLLLNGYTVIVEPVINIYPQKYSPVNFDNTEAIMLSSVNSVKILKNNIDKNIIKNIKAYCVGKVTEKWAQRSGFKCVETNSYSGKTLEQTIIKNSKHFKGEIIFFGGEKIAYNPAAAFKKAGIKYKRIILYKTIPIKVLSQKCSSNIVNKNVSHIIFYSPYIAEIFSKLSKNYYFMNTTAICLGKNTSKSLKKNKWKKVLITNDVDPKNFAKFIIER